MVSGPTMLRYCTELNRHWSVYRQLSYFLGCFNYLIVSKWTNNGSITYLTIINRFSSYYTERKTCVFLFIY